MRANLFVAPFEAVYPVVKAPDLSIQVTVKRRGAILYLIDPQTAVRQVSRLKVFGRAHLQIGARHFYALVVFHLYSLLAAAINRSASAFMNGPKFGRFSFASASTRRQVSLSLARFLSPW